MEAAAHEHSPEPSPLRRPRPALAAVPDRRSDPTTSPHGHQGEDESHIWRAGMVGAAIGFALLTVTITIAGTVGGMEPPSAFGLGAFVGTWGGSGFGFMTSASVSAAGHNDRARHDASTNHHGGH